MIYNYIYTHIYTNSKLHINVVDYFMKKLLLRAWVLLLRSCVFRNAAVETQKVRLFVKVPHCTDTRLYTSGDSGS